MRCSSIATTNGSYSARLGYHYSLVDAVKHFDSVYYIELVIDFENMKSFMWVIDIGHLMLFAICGVVEETILRTLCDYHRTSRIWNNLQPCNSHSFLLLEQKEWLKLDPLSVDGNFL